MILAFVFVVVLSPVLGVICSSSLGNLEGVTEWVEMTFKKDRLTSLLCFFPFV